MTRKVCRVMRVVAEADIYWQVRAREDLQGDSLSCVRLSLIGRGLSERKVRLHGQKDLVHSSLEVFY